jgi:hypothetical protein
MYILLLGVVLLLAFPSEDTIRHFGNIPIGEYVSHGFGVFLLCSVILIPLTYPFLLTLFYPHLPKLETKDLMFGSFFGCAIFFFSTSPRGHFYLSRYILFLAFIFFKAWTSSSWYYRPTIMIPGGVLGFFLMYICGRIGLIIGKRIRIQELYRPSSILGGEYLAVYSDGKTEFSAGNLVIDRTYGEGVLHDIIRMPDSQVVFRVLFNGQAGPLSVPARTVSKRVAA